MVFVMNQEVKSWHSAWKEKIGMDGLEIVKIIKSARERVRVRWGRNTYWRHTRQLDLVVEDKNIVHVPNTYFEVYIRFFEIMISFMWATVVRNSNSL